MNISLTQRKIIATSSITLMGLLLALIIVFSRSPHLASALAGSLLLMAGFALMAPCQLQMTTTLTIVVKNMSSSTSRETSPAMVRATAVGFACGYLTFYLLVALGLGLAAWSLGRYAWILTIAGGFVAVILGLTTLNILRHSRLATYRGPLWLIRAERASLRHPFYAGIAFGQCCATCCGPYIYALIILAGATATFWLGSGLVMLYAIMMVIPFLLPALLSPTVYTAVSDRLQHLTPQISQATGYTLVGLGILLIPVAGLLAGR